VTGLRADVPFPYEYECLELIRTSYHYVGFSGVSLTWDILLRLGVTMMLFTSFYTIPQQMGIRRFTREKASRIDIKANNVVLGSLGTYTFDSIIPVEY
jgi:hypothetical protein